ncbi:MAG TPA: DNA-processing protein DprA [Actinomycetota bacterium]|nr:DNA-processing protein DprA [Actinomycetota bacterium]
MLVLMALRGISPIKLLEVADRERAAEATLEAVRRGRAGSHTDREFARGLDPDDIDRALVACGASLVPFGSAGYPPQLENLEDPPAALFVKGRPLPPRERAVAIVGARNCSDLGRELATAIGHDLATSGVCVVSGAARGIDAAGHQGALDAGGHTVAVLGCGIDQAYPRWSERMIERIAKTGTLVSEYPPGIPPEPYHFPARNRIVAAMCTGLVVVEGAEGSGSLISAEHALDLGRDVFAVPGAITNPLAHVPNVLIREGATLIRGVDDLMRDLKLVDGRSGALMRLDLTLAEQAALELVGGPVLPEKVARGLGVSVPEVLPLLLGLELKGLIRSVGGRFEPRLKAATT